MKSILKTFFLVGAVAMLLCGCNGNIKLQEEKTEVSANEAVKGNTDRMLDLQMKSLKAQNYTMLHGVEGFDEFILYVPPMEAEHKSNSYLLIESNGITITFKINPNERQGATTFPIYQSVKELVNNRYYSDGYVGLDVGYAEDLSVDTARMTVNFFEDCFGVGYHNATHYLIDLNESKTLEIDVDICYDSITENTETIIAELEDYYNIDIEFDVEAALTKQQAYDDNPKAYPATFGYWDIAYELPAQWYPAIEEISDEMETVVYTPFDLEQSHLCGAMLTKTDKISAYVSKVAMEYPEIIIEPFEEESECELIENGVEEIGETILGDTLQLNFSYDSSEGEGTLVIFYGLKDNVCTCIYGYGVGQYSEIADDIALMILNSARKK